jgi:hypothetical protein
MVPLRECEIADAEIPLIHGLHVNAELAEQSESLGEQHVRSLAQPLIVVERGAQLEEKSTHRGIGNGPLREE